MRLTFEEFGCLQSLSAAISRSEDEHTKVGCCALDKDGGVICVSYNGLKKGMVYPEWMKQEENRKKKAAFTIHAEKNLTRYVKRGECKTLCLTIQPCGDCCQIIAALEIPKVVYMMEHPKYQEFREVLDFYNIQYQKLSKDSLLKIITILKQETNILENVLKGI